MPSCEEVTQKIQQALPDATVEVKDPMGKGDHFDVVVHSAEFCGKSRVQQHQLVMSALGDWMKKEIHALSLKTEEKEKS